MKLISVSNKNKKFDLIVLVVCLFIILIYNTRNIGNLTSPSILFDEFGYWASGASIVGNDWSSIVSAFCPYYSYGYGIILSIILSIFKNPSTSYQIAIVLNAVMVCGCFCISYFVFSKLFYFVNNFLIIIGSLIICFSPNIIHHTQFAWSETLLLFVFWLSLFNLFRIVSKPTILNMVSFTILISYLYMIHQRSLGVLIIGIITIVLLFCIKKISTKYLVFFIVTLIFMFFLQFLLKNHFFTELWSNYYVDSGSDSLTKLSGVVNSVSKTGDYEGQIEKINLIFSISGFRLFIISFLGKIFYMGISTFFLGFEGIFYILNKLKNTIFLIFYKKINLKDKDIIFIYIFGAYLTTLIISSIFMIYPSRIDTIIYGRYTDWLLGPLLLLGIINLFTCNFKKRFVMYYAFTSIYSIWLIKIIDEFNLEKYFAVCSPIGHFFRIKYNCDVIWVPYMVGILTLVSIFVFYLATFKNKTVSYVGVFTLILISWIFYTEAAIDTDISLNKTQEMQEITKELLEYKDENEKIYYVADFKEADITNLYIGSIQFLLNDISIECIEGKEIKNIENSLVIMPAEYTVEEDLLNKSTLILDKSIFKILRIR